MKIRKGMRKTALALALMMLFTSMPNSAQAVQAASKKTVKSVKITNVKGKKLTLKKGKKFTLKTKVTVSSKKVSKALRFKSSKPSVASVSGKGKITAKKVGTATITVFSKVNKKKKATIKVKVVAKKDSSGKKDKTDKKPTAENTGNGSSAGGNGSIGGNDSENSGDSPAATAFAKKIKDELDSLKSSLAQGAGGIYLLKTEEAFSLVLGKNDYSGIHLIVDAPKSHIENHAKFKSVTVLSISDSTFVEYVSEEEIHYLALKGRVKIGDGANGVKIICTNECGKIEVSKNGGIDQLQVVNDAADAIKDKSLLNAVGDAPGNSSDGDGSPDKEIEIENNGKISNIDIEAPVSLGIQGKSDLPIDVDVEEIAQADQQSGSGVTIGTNQELEIKSKEKIDLSLEPGAEHTTVEIADKADIPEVEGVGAVAVTIANNGKVIDYDCIVGKNNGAHVKYTTAHVSGHVKTAKKKKNKFENEDGEEEEIYVADEVASADVYAIPYDKKIKKNNVEQYLDKAVAKTQTDEDGDYSFENLPAGNYVIVIIQDGYQPVLDTLVLTSEYTGSDEYTEEALEVVEEDVQEKGTLSGVITNAETGEPVGEGFTVRLRSGSGNFSGDDYEQTTTDASGVYTFEELLYGNYTVQVIDLINSEEDSYLPGDFDADIAGEETRVDGAVTPLIAKEKMRFVLTWGNYESGASADLDIHLVRTDLGKETDLKDHTGHVYQESSFRKYKVRDITYAELDTDEKNFNGPETITLNVNNGVYDIYVHDFSNSGKKHTAQLAASDATIMVYRGSTMIGQYFMPYQEGSLWRVLSYNAKTKTISTQNSVCYWTTKREQYSNVVGKNLFSGIESVYINYFPGVKQIYETGLDEKNEQYASTRTELGELIETMQSAYKSKSYDEAYDASQQMAQFVEDYTEEIYDLDRAISVKGDLVRDTMLGSSYVGNPVFRELNVQVTRENNINAEVMSESEFAANGSEYAIICFDGYRIELEQDKSAFWIYHQGYKAKISIENQLFFDGIKGASCMYGGVECVDYFRVAKGDGEKSGIVLSVSVVYDLHALNEKQNSWIIENLKFTLKEPYVSYEYETDPQQIYKLWVKVKDDSGNVVRIPVEVTFTSSALNITEIQYNGKKCNFSYQQVSLDHLTVHYIHNLYITGMSVGWGDFKNKLKVTARSPFTDIKIEKVTPPDEDSEDYYEYAVFVSYGGMTYQYNIIQPRP